jgi:hypothetical protein
MKSKNTPKLPKPEAEHPERIPLGGFFESYEESYANAWRELMPKSQNMALPILYLQRHTFELVIKAVLKSTIEERRTLHELDELFGTTSGPGPGAPTDFELVHTTHEFGRLLPRLVANLVALGRPSMPEEFGLLRDLFFSVDEDNPDRLRFGTQFSRRKGTTTRSFPHFWEDKKKKSAPCQEVADLLEKVLTARKGALDKAVGRDTPPPDSPLGHFFLAEYEAYLATEEEVSSRLGPISEASRNGELHWSEVEAKSIHVEAPHALETLTQNVSGGLTATFQGRTLILVWLKGIVQVSRSKGELHEDSSFLAAQRPNGTLTAGVWLEGYQAKVADEVIEAFKRDKGIE